MNERGILSAREDKIFIPKRPCNILHIHVLTPVNTSPVGELSGKNVIIFTCENNMLSLHVKILWLLWLLGKLHLGQQKILKSNFICGYIINETLHGHLEMQISVLVLKILYRYTAMSYPLFPCYFHAISMRW